MAQTFSTGLVIAYAAVFTATAIIVGWALKAILHVLRVIADRLDPSTPGGLADVLDRLDGGSPGEN